MTYRGEGPKPTVTCGDCRTTILQADSMFGIDGAMLCARCHSMREAHAQVERGRAAAYDLSAGGGVVVQAIRQVMADNAATRSHVELASLGRSTPMTPAQQGCARCGTVVASSDIVYGVDGSTMCLACSRSYDAAGERRKLEGSLWRGLALGFLFSVAGIAVVYAMGRPEGEKRGALVGAGVSGVFLYFVFQILVGPHR